MSSIRDRMLIRPNSKISENEIFDIKRVAAENVVMFIAEIVSRYLAQ